MQAAVGLDEDADFGAALAEEGGPCGDLVAARVAGLGVVRDQGDAHGGPSVDDNGRREILTVWEKRCNAGSSVDVQIRAELLEDLLALLVPHHQIDALPAVLALQALLGFAEERQITLPVTVAAGLAALLQRRGAILAQALEKLVFERQVELARAD